ncbi:MAG: carbohydrate-binding protein [Planctomycetaceae bacterium]|nr:carbohydrate-binding protein [Planctomycetaceae bacterium]
MSKLACLFAVTLLVVMSPGAAHSLNVDFNGNSYGSVIEQTQSGFQVYNARNEVPGDFVARQYSAFGTTVTITPSWAAGATAAAMQSWSRGNSYGYSTAPGDMLDLVIDWIGTDQREVGDPMTLTISGLPAGVYEWRSYHHDTQNQTGHFSVTVNDAAGSVTMTGLQVSSSQSLSDVTLADVTKFDTTITSDGVNPVTLVFEATDAPNYNTMFVMNGFEIANGISYAWRSGAALRRPVCAAQPMWLIHIDTWNYADPQKIIALIPPDIRPYVVMNIGLSISHDETTSRFQVAEYGSEIAKSWLRACAENRMWAIVQPSSGGFSQFSDFDLSIYEEFYRDYPNMIGFNYCEQFWGYDSTTDPLSAKWADRIAHFANLLKLSDRYGGYLVVSWCGNQWSPNINPIAMLKRNPAFAAACRQYTDNYILCEKYTQQSYISDMESLCLGTWLSGYSGQYGIRYDDTGWTDASGEHANFTMATYGAPFLEHVMLTGMTVIDAPELIWTQCFREISAGSTSNGYTMRRWETFPQFDNVSVDLFRKILDGTVRIPTRREVIDRTKIAIINNINSGSIDDIYSSPETLFEGLYRMDGDGNLRYNKTFFKKTGRYPTIPTVYQLDDADAQSFQVQVNKSAYSTRWPSTSAKVTELNNLFPEEYTGDIYASRHENAWVTYNPYKTGQTASGSIPFKYNTCDRMELTYSQYTAGVIKEYADRVTFYLSNYDNVIDTSLKTDTIIIHGCTSEPTYSYADRASHQASIVTGNWDGGVFTLTVRHNGPLDITVNCGGTATGRLTDYTTAVLAAPAAPLTYTGPLQYEAECFDYRNIAGIVKGGYPEPVRNYTGQGYLQFGTNSAAAVRDTVTVPKTGTYRLETRYAVIGTDITAIDLYVNGTRVCAPVFSQTPTLSDWAVNQENIILTAGANTIEFRAIAAAPSSIYFDNIVAVPSVHGEGMIIQEGQNGFAGLDGTIENTYAGYTGSGYANPDESVGSGVNWRADLDSSAVKAFTFRYACADNRTADLIVNGEIVAAQIQFPSTGSWSAWDFVTVYASTDSGVSGVRLQSSLEAGLPNIDYIELTGVLLYGDMNRNGIVNSDDLPEFAASWLEENGELDLNADGLINMHEFTQFAANWLAASTH